MAKREENPRELVRLFEEIDHGLLELNKEVQEILDKVDDVIGTKQRRSN
jgi:hypothetical protein